MQSIYQEQQRQHQIELINHSEEFENAPAGVEYRGKIRDFILQEGKYNLREEIRDQVIAYFKKNKISWWGGKTVSGHVLSSQVACLNHLFPLRDQPVDLLKAINSITNRQFKELMPIPDWLDAKEDQPHYVAFEVISHQDYLNETKEGQSLTRGSNCTSVDALVIAKDWDDTVYLLPIEWKYTEFYNNEDKSKEGRPGADKCQKSRGQVRLDRYSHLISRSEQLMNPEQYAGSIYFQEPFYQLMRQTLWVENVIKNEKSDWQGATKYLHLHFVPRDNKDLLERNYKRFPDMDGMVNTWKAQLVQPEWYQCVDPKDCFLPLKDKYPDLIHYLDTRYWK